MRTTAGADNHRQLCTCPTGTIKYAVSVYHSQHPSRSTQWKVYEVCQLQGTPYKTEKDTKRECMPHTPKVETNCEPQFKWSADLASDERLVTPQTED